MGTRGIGLSFDMVVGCGGAVDIMILCIGTIHINFDVDGRGYFSGGL
jgi:hypothetical protein